MKNLSIRFSMSLVLFLTLQSCGVGNKIVKDLKFVTEQSGESTLTGFDATVVLNGLALPQVELPIQSPKNKSIQMGTFKIEAENKISVRLDLKLSTKLSPLKGDLLPNGKNIPVTLPDGVIPISFPIKNTNSLIYLAFGGGKMMVGFALPLKTDLGGTLGDLLKTTTNLFFPFTINETTSGSAGVFSGSEFGLGVFAIKSLSGEEKKLIGEVSGVVHTMEASPVSGSGMEAKLETPNRKKSFQFLNSIREIRHIELK